MLSWAFHVVDGNAGPRRTTGVVQSVVAVRWDDALSLFYADMSHDLIRHAWRRVGDTHWQYELLDGAGGPDGRVAAKVSPLIAACAGGRHPDGTPTRPVFVSYRWVGGTGSNVRLATLM